MALSACHSCRCAASSHAECKPTTVPTTAHLGASDTYETKDCVYVKVDIPGMSKSDVKVTITDGMLHVVGQRAKESTNKDINFFHIERQYGHFSRFFKLPDYSDLSRISATCDHGVLTIAVPKVTGAPAVAPADVTVCDKDDEGDGELNKEFSTVPISVFPTPSLGKLVILDSSMPLLDAVKMLSQYHILAAPVRDVSKADDTPWTEKYLGIFDMVSVVNYMLERLAATGDDFAQEAEKVQEFTSTTVAAAAKFARFGPFVPVDFSRGTLLDAMLLCGQHAIRRVPVVKSPGGDIVNIITQSALVQTLAANLDRFGSVAKQTLAKLGLASPARVFKVTSGDTLRAAFNLIKEYDISAVPVVDAETGKICGNISARDVRLVVTSSKVYKLLNMTIRVYLDVVSDGAANSAITCKPEDTMETVITRLVHSRIHRIYVVDGEDHIIRVVSLRNVLRKFVKEPQGFFGHYFS